MLTTPSLRGTLVGLVLLLSTSACAGAGGQSGSGPGSSATGPNTVATAQQELAYGRAPVPGGGITYRPDVILVGGGAAMVRSVSGDSLTWSIDARAPHLNELKPGKVMFLTARAVGRVLNLEPRGDVVAVTLGPVDLTDVISDGDININGPIDVATMTFQTFPDVPGLVETSPSGMLKTPVPASGTMSATPALWSPGGGFHAPNNRASSKNAAALAALPGADDPLPEPSKGSSVKVSLGDYSGTVTRVVVGRDSKLSLKVAYKKKGVTVGVDFIAKFVAPRITSSLGFSGGALTRKEARIDGLEEVSIGLVSGSESGLSGNIKSRIEVPAEITVPWPVSPVPLVLSFRFKFIVETAFSAKNATLSATGKVKLDGPIGFSGTNVLLPKVTQKQSPVDNVVGVSVGVNGVVVAEQIKVVLGLGIPAAFTGPFAAVTLSYGVTNGSAIGIVQCKEVSVDVVLGYGAGFTLAPGQSTFFKTFREKFPWAPKLDSELASGATTVLHKVSHLPKVGVC